jgi:hypothetical protein
MQFEDVQKATVLGGVQCMGTAIHEGAGLRDLQRTIWEV